MHRIETEGFSYLASKMREDVFNWLEDGHCPYEIEEFVKSIGETLLKVEDYESMPYMHKMLNMIEKYKDE